MSWTSTYEFSDPLRDLRSTPHEAAALHAELMRELAPGHVLHGVDLHVLARAIPQDEAVVETGDGRVALVHLSWSGRPETPPWPRTELVTSAQHLETLLEFRY